MYVAMNLLKKKFYVFPRGSDPVVNASRVPFRRKFSEKEREVIRRVKERVREDPVGDGIKLSVQKMKLNPNAEIEVGVCDILFSEMIGLFGYAEHMFAQRKEREGYLQRKGARVLLSDNLIISGDGKILLSRSEELVRTPLNGIVESSTLDKCKGRSIIQKTIAKELKEEYGLEGDFKMRLHSVHIGLGMRPGSVRVFGSVHIPLPAIEIIRFKDRAPDAWENPEILTLDNVPEEIESFARTGNGQVATLLRVYSCRMFN